jgi:hypothetical protein
MADLTGLDEDFAELKKLNHAVVSRPASANHKLTPRSSKAPMNSNHGRPSFVRQSPSRAV